MNKSRPTILIVNIIAYVLAYYLCILLHEWVGHGLMAWILGQKTSPFDIYYGGWGLFHVDENVDYTGLMAANMNLYAALIAINGVIVTFLLFVLGLFLLANARIQKNIVLFSVCYWSVVINMIPLLQYLTLTAFSSGGDTGHFIKGLGISPWWIFIPGTAFVVCALWRILNVEIVRAYKVMSIESLSGRRVVLAVTLFTIFLFIYTHGFNPLTDTGTNLGSKILTIISIMMAPVLFFIYM